MQKLTYINLRNEQIQFAGAPYILSGISGLGMPDIDIETLRGAYQQGDTIAGVRRAHRVVTAAITLWGASRADLYARRMTLLGILSPDRAIDDNNARARLIYENDYGRWWTYAVPESGLESGSKRVANAQPGLKVIFRCESPYWYAMVEETVAFTYSGTGFSLPFSFPVQFGSREYAKEVNNVGQVAAPVRIWVECKGEIPSLFNRSTGKRIALSEAVPLGYTVYINTDPARLEATIIDVDGNETGAFGKLSLETPLADFSLRAGLNTLVYESGGETAQSVIRVQWNPTYEGV